MPAPEGGLTTVGLAFMVTAWTIITALVSYCFWKILRARNDDGAGDDR